MDVKNLKSLFVCGGVAVKRGFLSFVSHSQDESSEKKNHFLELETGQYETFEIEPSLFLKYLLRRVHISTSCCDLFPLWK